jgi:hypothetical protein
LKSEKSGAEADLILDAAAGFGPARETKAKPASTMTDKGEQAVDNKLGAVCLTTACASP